ncbi:unnamed protein product [Triticum turgidum subsp. durum]|uniref:F-box domain-containing protein n=1 Tax=Triticum turgidum subsp. durum TaxID=4567 RepID=A0A9R1AVT2_TRITD|nr:unnamed protein product [Triticum turgidum subsp. durum]
MEPIQPTATQASKIRVQHEPADGGYAASGAIGALPIHLIEKILGFASSTSPLDSVCLAVVCKSWAAAVSERLARPTPHLFALKLANVHSQSPLRFMLPPEEERRHRGAIYSLPVNEEGSPSLVAPARLPSVVRDPKGMNFKLSGALPCGLLSFAVGNRVVLVNPITGAFRSDVYAPFGTGAKVRAVASANAIFDHDYAERSVPLCWCTGEWSERKLLSEEFKNIYLMAYTDGVFYALEFRGCAYTVDTRVPPPWRLKKLRAPSILEQYTPIRGRFLCYSHLLESEGAVLFVGPVLAPRQPTCRDTIGGFEVYRLDVEAARWVKVERLAADRALFVSEQSSFSVRASEVPGCMSNCIYFVGEVDDYSYVTWGVYSMEERKVLFQRPVGGSWGRCTCALYTREKGQKSKFFRPCSLDEHELARLALLWVYGIGQILCQGVGVLFESFGSDNGWFLVAIFCDGHGEVCICALQCSLNPLALIEPEIGGFFLLKTATLVPFLVKGVTECFHLSTHIGRAGDLHPTTPVETRQIPTPGFSSGSKALGSTVCLKLQYVKTSADPEGYEINGNTFYTIDQDQKSTNQNSGVRFDATTEKGKDTYYDYIVDIWELDYGQDFKVPLFKCKWVNLSGGGVHVDPQYGMTTVDLKNLGYTDESFVLANDVVQVIYVKDMSTGPRKRKDKEMNTSYDEPKRHIIFLGKRDILGVEGKTDMSEDYERFHEIPAFNVKADPSILINDVEYPWLRRNKKMTQAKKK